MSTGAPRKVTIGGLEVEIEDSPQSVDVTEAPLFKKSDRSTISAEKLNDLFDKIAAGCKQKYELPTLSLRGTDQLEEVYDLENTIRTTRQHYAKYDMDGIFNIVLHDKNDPAVVTGSKSLFQDYVNLTVEEVALSNSWYRKMPRGEDIRLYYSQDLKVTAEHLEHSIDESLLSKCFETYLTYPTEQRGGPLLFKIMIDKVQTTTATAVEYILKTITTLKLSELKGENVSTAVSLIRGGLSRVRNYSDPLTKAGAVPHDLNKTLCKAVFQSSSSDEFNEVFKQIYRSSKIMRLSGNPPTLPTTEQLLTIAENHYLDLSQTNAWSGVDIPGSSAFNVATSKRHCFNCGSAEHASNDCPKPANPAIIKKNKEAFYEKLKAEKQKGSRSTTTTSQGGRGRGRGGRSSQGGRGQGNNSGRGSNSGISHDWSPPTDAEKANQNRRTINGKLMYYHPRKKRWYPVPVHANTAETARDTTASDPEWINRVTQDVVQAAILNRSTPSDGQSTTSDLTTTQALSTVGGRLDGETKFLYTVPPINTAYTFRSAAIPVRSSNLHWNAKRRKGPKQYYLSKRTFRRPIRKPYRDKPSLYYTILQAFGYVRRVPIQSDIGQIKTSATTKRRKFDRGKVQSTLLTQQEPTLNTLNDEDFDLIKHKLYHRTDFMFDMQFGILLDEFSQLVDPIKHYRTLLMCASDKILFGRSDPITCLTTTTSGFNATTMAGVAMALFHRQQEGPTTAHTRLSVSNTLTQYGLKVTSDVPIVIDTGASFSLTPLLDDFVTELTPAPIDEIRGITATARVVGQGLVEWPIRDVFGRIGIVRTMAYYVPDAHIRLFSPQIYFQENENCGECLIQGQKTILTMPDGSQLDFPYNAYSNLPLMLLDYVHKCVATTANLESLQNPSGMASLLSVADQMNQNLSPAQRELLSWHWKLGHSHFDWNQALMRNKRVGPDAGATPPIIPKRRGVSNCPTSDMLCTACQLAKQGRRLGNLHSHSSGDPILRANSLCPGDKVSTDQYTSALGGRLPNTKGKEPKKDKFNGGTIFCDHATQYIHITHQVSLKSGETILAKRSFERMALQFGVKIKSYRADNHPFGSVEFREELQATSKSVDWRNTIILFKTK